jgi:hypothetical protein
MHLKTDTSCTSLKKHKMRPYGMGSGMVIDLAKR